MTIRILLRILRYQRTIGVGEYYMQPPVNITRTTLSNLHATDLPIAGCYVIAYMGSIVYVGKSIDLPYRLRHHLISGTQAIDLWLRRMTHDYDNIRIDLLESPRYEWENDAEIALIHYFKPLMNLRMYL